MNTCAACLAEVRWGTRSGRLAWWHHDDRPDTRITRTARVNADGSPGHEPILGHASADVDWGHIADLAASYAQETNETDDNRVFEIPPVEVAATEIFVTKPPDPRMPGGAKDLINAVVKAGGRARATYSRAARVHASHGNLLGMGDYVVVKLEVEGRTGVGRWEDGQLDVSYITDYDPATKTVTPIRVNSKPLRDWLVKAERTA